MAPVINEKRTNEDVEKHVLSVQYRYTKTCLLFLSSVSVGMSNKITGSAMFDLLDRVDSNYEGLSQAISMQQVFRVIGSIVGGLLVDKLPRCDDIIMTLIMLTYSVSIFVKPWISVVEILGVSYALQGFVNGGMTAVMNYMLIKMWGRKVSVVLLIVHMGAPIGRFLAPLLTEPFLGETNRTKDDGAFRAETTTVPRIGGDSNQTIEEPEISRIEIPFSIISGIFVLQCLFFFALRFFKPKQTSHETSRKSLQLKTMCDPGSCTEGKRGFGLFMCIGIVLYFFSIKGVDESMMSYMFTYAMTSELQFSKKEASLLDSMQGLGVAVGRGLSAILGLCIPIQYLLLPLLICANGLLAALCFLGTKSKTLLWVFTVLVSIVVGPVWPGAIIWANRYVEMTGVMCSLVDIGLGSGGFVSHWAIGVILDYEDSIYVLYYSLGSLLVALTIMVVMYVVGGLNGDRYKRAIRRIGEGTNNDYFSEIVVDEPTT